MENIRILTKTVATHHKEYLSNHLRKTKGVDIIDELLRQNLVETAKSIVIPGAPFHRNYGNFIRRYVPHGNVTTRCNKCKTHAKARSVMELHTALAISRRFEHYYMCFHCHSSTISFLSRGKWIEIKNEINKIYRCKICGGKSISYRGMLLHFKRIRKLKPAHLKALEIAMETGRLP